LKKKAGQEQSSLINTKRQELQGGNHTLKPKEVMDIAQEEEGVIKRLAAGQSQTRL